MQFDWSTWLCCLRQERWAYVLTCHAQGSGKPLPTLSPATLEKIQAAAPSAATVAPNQPRRVLVFWRCEGFVPRGRHRRRQPCPRPRWAARRAPTRPTSATTTPRFEPANLAKYDVLVLNNTTQLKLPDAVRAAGPARLCPQRQRARRHPRRHRFVLRLARGGRAARGAVRRPPVGRRRHLGLQARRTRASAEPGLAGGKGFKLQDEIYQFKAPYTRADRRVLVSLDLSDAATGAVKKGVKRTDGDFAVAWIKLAGQGASLLLQPGARRERVPRRRPCCGSTWTASSMPRATCRPTPSLGKTSRAPGSQESPRLSARPAWAGAEPPGRGGGAVPRLGASSAPS